MPLAILCSGQGSQHAEMFARLAAEPAATAVIDRIEAATGIDLRSGPIALEPRAMAGNRIVQPLIVGHALAAHAALVENGVEAAVFAGYSAGEIAAHACAGAWSMGDAFEIVFRRAACMEASLEGRPEQGMTALIGPPVAETRAMAEAAGVALAIVNGPDHAVVGGELDGLDRFDKAAAGHARHLRRLNVRIASHTRFIADAGPCFAQKLSATRWRAPGAPVLSGLDGRAIRTSDAATDFLSRQLYEPLDWSRCLACVFEYGATAVLEIGPGRTLTKMVEEAYPDIPARAFEDFRTAAGAAAWARRHA